MIGTHLSRWFSRDLGAPADSSPTVDTRANSAYRPSARPAGRAQRDPYLDFALRWWGLLLVGLAVGTLGALAFLKFGPISYVSTAYVQVNPPLTAADKSTSQALVANLAAEAQSPYIRVLVSQALPKILRLSSADFDRMSQDGTLAIKQLPDATASLTSLPQSDCPGSGVAAMVHDSLGNSRLRFLRSGRFA